MIKINTRGSFRRTEQFLTKMSSSERYSTLSSAAQRGLNALAKATPVDSGVTADSWSYDIKTTPRSTTITWSNSNVVDNVPVVILLQYGHATGTGGFVEGENFINPAIRPVFNKISDDVWKAVVNS